MSEDRHDPAFYQLMVDDDDYVCGCWCGCTRRVCTADETPMCACDDVPRCDDCHLSDHCAEEPAA